ncbi:MAG TPA: hypothetical protein VNE71_16865, partial [Myxococcota bacterium]|nr:hypothetical protein [Myxococcota bacterium]
LARAALTTHPDVGSYVGQLRRKFAMALCWYEVPNNTNFYYYRLHSRALSLLPVTFALVAPLALLGLALALPRLRQLAVAYLLVAALLAPLLVFYVLSRFRVSLALALIPFAAAALVTLLRWTAERRWGRCAAALVALAVLGAWTWRPLGADRALIRRADWVVPLEVYYAPRMEDDFRRRDWRAAVALLDRALALEPPEVTALRAGEPPRNDDAVQYASVYGMVHFRLAQALERAGDTERAAKESRIARALLVQGRLSPPDPATDPILR